MAIDLSSSGKSDKLIVNGAVVIGNGNKELNVRFIAGAAGLGSKVGNSWNIVQATSLTGQFNKVNLPTLPAGRSWSVQYTATGISLSIIAS